MLWWGILSSRAASAPAGRGDPEATTDAQEDGWAPRWFREAAMVVQRASTDDEGNEQEEDELEEGRLEIVTYPCHAGFHRLKSAVRVPVPGMADEPTWSESQRQPAWAPTGQLLASCGLAKPGPRAEGSRAQRVGSHLACVLLTDRSGRRVLQVRLPEGFLPFFLSWSSCGNYLAMLSNWPGRRVCLRVLDVASALGPARAPPRLAFVGAAAPLFLNWCPSAPRLYVHARRATYALWDAARGSFRDCTPEPDRHVAWAWLAPMPSVRALGYEPEWRTFLTLRSAPDTCAPEWFTDHRGRSRLLLPLTADSARRLQAAAAVLAAAPTASAAGPTGGVTGRGGSDPEEQRAQAPPGCEGGGAEDRTGKANDGGDDGELSLRLALGNEAAHAAAAAAGRGRAGSTGGAVAAAAAVPAGGGDDDDDSDGDSDRDDSDDVEGAGSDEGDAGAGGGAQEFWMLALDPGSVGGPVGRASLMATVHAPGPRRELLTAVSPDGRLLAWALGSELWCQDLAAGKAAASQASSCGGGYAAAAAPPPQQPWRLWPLLAEVAGAVEPKLGLERGSQGAVVLGMQWSPCGTRLLLMVKDSLFGGVDDMFGSALRHFVWDFAVDASFPSLPTATVRRPTGRLRDPSATSGGGAPAASSPAGAAGPPLMISLRRPCRLHHGPAHVPDDGFMSSYLPFLDQYCSGPSPALCMWAPDSSAFCAFMAMYLGVAPGRIELAFSESGCMFFLSPFAPEPPHDRLQKAAAAGSGAAAPAAEAATAAPADDAVAFTAAAEANAATAGSNSAAEAAQREASGRTGAGDGLVREAVAGAPASLGPHRAQSTGGAVAGGAGWSAEGGEGDDRISDGNGDGGDPRASEGAGEGGDEEASEGSGSGEESDSSAGDWYKDKEDSVSRALATARGVATGSANAGAGAGVNEGAGTGAGVDAGAGASAGAGGEVAGTGGFGSGGAAGAGAGADEGNQSVPQPSSSRAAAAAAAPALPAAPPVVHAAELGGDVEVVRVTRRGATGAMGDILYHAVPRFAPR